MFIFGLSFLRSSKLRIIPMSRSVVDDVFPLLLKLEEVSNGIFNCNLEKIRHLLFKKPNFNSSMNNGKFYLKF